MSSHYRLTLAVAEGRPIDGAGPGTLPATGAAGFFPASLTGGGAGADDGLEDEDDDPAPSPGLEDPDDPEEPLTLAVVDEDEDGGLGALDERVLAGMVA